MLTPTKQGSMRWYNFLQNPQLEETITISVTVVNVATGGTGRASSLPIPFPFELLEITTNVQFDYQFGDSNTRFGYGFQDLTGLAEDLDFTDFLYPFSNMYPVIAGNKVVEITEQVHSRNSRLSVIYHNTSTIGATNTAIAVFTIRQLGG